jgi:Lar family restriction alleviation protein
MADALFCPFCGTDQTKYIRCIEIPHRHNHYVVVCSACNAVGPFSTSKQGAWKQWNTRGRCGHLVDSGALDPNTGVSIDIWKPCALLASASFAAEGEGDDGA